MAQAEIKKRSASTDMTTGSAASRILVFALPLLAGSALQQLYNMVDSIVVGRFVGSTALAAVGVAFPVVFMLSSLFMGLGMGAMVMVSQYFGAKDTDNLRRTLDTVYTALMVGVIPLSVFGAVIVKPIISMLAVPADMQAETFIYLIILMIGLIGSLGYNLNAGILQGVGNSKVPLLFLAIACAINIGLDLLLVVVFHMGVAGVAIATIVAQIFSWLFGIFYINRKFPEVKLRPFSFQFDRRIFKEIIRLGLPTGIQMSLFSIASMVLSRLVNSYGSTFAAGFGAANKLDTFAFLPIQSITTAATSFTGQNIGANKLHRVKDGTAATLKMCLGFSILGLLVIPAGPYLMRMFSDDPAVIDAGMAFIYRIMPCYSLLAVLFTLNSVMRGAGESIMPMVSAILSSTVIRVPAAYILAAFFGRDNLNWCYGIGWLVALCLTVPYYLSGKWKNRAVTRAGETVELPPEVLP